MPTVLCQGLRVSTAVRLIGLEPTRLAAPDPKSGVSTNSTTSALERLRDSTNQPFDGAKVRNIAELANIFGQKMQAGLLFSVFTAPSDSPKGGGKGFGRSNVHSSLFILLPIGGPLPHGRGARRAGWVFHSSLMITPSLRLPSTLMVRGCGKCTTRTCSVSSAAGMALRMSWR